MKRQLAALVLACGVTVSAPANDWWMPSPISVAITVGKWIMQEREQVYYVRVRSTGRDETSAREQAFRLAVEQAIGALVLAETEVRRGNVDRNEIISFSSGFVQDFKILETKAVGAGKEIVIDVWVARSHLADRLLSTSRADARVEGGRISRQIETFQNSRTQGDRVLATVLADFPYRAISLKLGRTQVLVNEYRQPVLSIWLDISWDQRYLKSLDEAVARTSHAPDCDNWLSRAGSQCQNKIRVKVLETTGYFDDRLVAELIQRNMANDPPRIDLRILNTAGETVYTDCITPLGVDPYEYYPHHFYSPGHGLSVNPYASRSGDIRVDLTQLATRDLDRVDVKMIRRSECPEVWRPR